MAQVVTVPVLGADGLLYYFAADASGGSAAGVIGGGLVQLDGSLARYATILTNSSGVGATTWQPDGSHNATRLVGILNGGAAPISVVLTLYDAVANAQTLQFWSGSLAATGQPILLNYPLTNGVTWKLSGTLTAGNPLILLAN